MVELSQPSHVILGGGVPVCLLLSAHCAVVFAIAQLSCFKNQDMIQRVNKEIVDSRLHSRCVTHNNYFRSLSLS